MQIFPASQHIHERIMERICELDEQDQQALYRRMGITTGGRYIAGLIYESISKRSAG